MSPSYQKFRRSQDNTVNGVCRSSMLSFFLLFSSESKSFCRIQGANASGTSLTLAYWGGSTVCFDMTLPWAFQWIFSTMEDGKKPWGHACQVLQCWQNPLGFSSDFSFWARLKGDVRHISHQPVIRANSLQTRTSTWRCSEVMQCQWM